MKRTIFIGQAMPRFKKNPHDWPSLNNWLYSIGVNDNHIKKYFFYSALVDYFPGSKNGSHLVPTKEEIKKERPRLAKTIRSFNPKVVLPIGRLSISHCLDESIAPLTDYIGNVYLKDPYQLLGKKITIIPLPHPSGASTWRHKLENKRLLKKSLALLKKHLA